MRWMNFRVTLPAIAMAVTGALSVGTASKQAYACSGDPYMGMVCAFSFDFCPQGFLPADGRLMTIHDNQALFSLLMNKYGGDGRTTFALPDYRGRSLVGQGSAPGLSQVTLGQRRGQEEITLKPTKTMPTSEQPGSGPQAMVQPVATLPPQMGVTYCIATQGMYPVRPY
ncbi:MAG: phage tail protein [Magnetospirillum sp.]